MIKWGVSKHTSKDPIRRIGAMIIEIKVGTMGIKIERAIMFEMGITTATKTSTRITMVTKMIAVGPMCHLKIVKLLLRMVEVVWRELRICCKK